MLLKVHPDNPQQRLIDQAVDILKSGGVIVFPTDTIYAIGCDSENAKAFEKLCRIQNVKPQKANFSFLFDDLSQIARYTKPFERNVFKMLKANLPGSFTFILPASNLVPSLFRNNKKTIGIRIPDNQVVMELVQRLGRPLVSASIHDNTNEIAGYLTDPEEIHERYEQLVDAVIDGGYGKNTASTIIDCTGPEPIITRSGLGDIQE
jgi:tRNA threonylcarbamoyl adenosine modification protein (Sua5/YciO/YrdC/YwlC family)